MLAVLAAVADYPLFGMPETGVPYNYPLFVGLLYIVSVLVILRTFYRIIDDAKAELIDIINGMSADNVMFERKTTVTPATIESEVSRVLNTAFHPYGIFSGGFVGGIFVLSVMWLFGFFQYYPNLMMNYAYGAGHRFFYGPIIGTVYLVYKVSTEYIVDIDILDPDGVGGYRDFGNAIVNRIVVGSISSPSISSSCRV